MIFNVQIPPFSLSIAPALTQASHERTRWNGSYRISVSISDLKDERNSVSVGEEATIQVQGAHISYGQPTSKIETLAMITAAHAVFYQPFHGPCKALLEVLYRKTPNSSTPVGAVAKKILSMVQ